MPVDRIEYEISWLDPAYMAARPDCDLALAERSEFFDDEACARQEAAAKAARLDTTIQLRRIAITGERYRNDPLAEREAGEPEEF